MGHVIKELQELRTEKTVALSPAEILRYSKIAVDRDGMNYVHKHGDYKDLMELQMAAIMLLGISKATGMFNWWLRPGDNPPDAQLFWVDHTAQMIRTCDLEIKSVTDQGGKVKNPEERSIDLIRNKSYRKNTWLLIEIDYVGQLNLRKIVANHTKFRDELSYTGVTNVWSVWNNSDNDADYTVQELYPGVKGVNNPLSSLPEAVKQRKKIRIDPNKRERALSRHVME